SDGVGHAVTIEVDQPDGRILEVEAWRDVVAAKRAPIPFTAGAEREESGESRRGDHEIDSAVAVGVQHLEPRIGEPQPGRSLAHIPGQIELSVSQVAPVTDAAVHLDDIRKTAAEQVGELEIGMRERAGWQFASGEREEATRLGLERGVAEFERR